MLIAHVDRAAELDRAETIGDLRFGTVFSSDDSSDLRPRSPRGARLEALLESQPSTAVLPEPDPKDPAFIFFTSGSTGTPMGVTHTVDSIGWIAASKSAGLALTPDDTFLTASSMSHEGGVGFSFGALSAGSSVAIRDCCGPILQR